MLVIKNNLMAENAARYLSLSYDSLGQSIERLSSGLRINSAKDDAAGLAVRELMRADIAVLRQGARNASDGISMLQTMEGAMSTIDQLLVRMKELAEQASTGSYSSQQKPL
jgi:flagellin